MKPMLFVIIFTLALNACSLFDDEDESFPNCDRELLDKVEEQGSISVWVRYDMPYTPEAELTEEESEAQREAIDEMNQKFYETIEHKLEEYISIRNTFNSLASITVSAKPAGLEYICQLDMVSDVSEVRGSTLKN